MRDKGKVIYRGADWDDLKVGEINAANEAFKLGTLINLTQSQLNFLEDKHGDSLNGIKQSDELVKELIKKSVKGYTKTLKGKTEGGDDIDNDNTK